MKQTNKELDKEIAELQKKIKLLKEQEEREKQLIKEKEKEIEIQKQFQQQKPSLISRIFRKDEVHLQTEDYNKPTLCPLCKSKIIKGKVRREENIVKQTFKCKNNDCVFVKEFVFEV